MNFHSVAVSIEMSIRGMLNCERFGLGGIVDADYIEYGGMYTAIACGLASKYTLFNKDKIDRFLESLSEYDKKELSQIGMEKSEQVLSNLDELIKELV